MLLLNTSLVVVWSLPALAEPVAASQDALFNSLVRIVPIVQPAGCIGFRVTAADKPVAVIHLGPGGTIRARTMTWRRRPTRASCV